jgi:hypothetical protein
MSFLIEYTGTRKVGKADRNSHAACFIDINGKQRVYDLTAMVNFFFYPPPGFSEKDRALVNTALEVVAMRNFGMVRTP